jgi:hypothetical protein
LSKRFGSGVRSIGVTAAGFDGADKGVSEITLQGDSIGASDTIAQSSAAILFHLYGFTIFQGPHLSVAKRSFDAFF